MVGPVPVARRRGLCPQQGGCRARGRHRQANRANWANRANRANRADGADRVDGADGADRAVRALLPEGSAQRHYHGTAEGRAARRDVLLARLYFGFGFGGGCSLKCS